jgi:hypothetical protein
MANRKPRDRRVRIDGILYPYRDGTENVELDRKMIDIMKGKRGIAGECMNARCIQRSPEAFSHPVLAVSVIKSRVYIFESLDSVVRYELSGNAAREIHEHDDEGVGSPGKLTLYAPKGNRRKGQRAQAKNRPEGRRTGTRARGLSKGEEARLVVAVGAMSN